MDDSTQISSQKFGKRLSVVAGVLMLLILAVDVWQGKVDINNTFALLFSCWVCIGSWHVFSMHERGEESSFADIYLWFLKYINK